MVVYFKGLEICNFKSFKGKVTLGSFNDFMAIVGPNGSGKSNVIDAICFVMGEIARNLRVKRISELICGASIEKPVMDSVYVTAFFELHDGRSKTFTRSIRSASSEFRIDGQVVTVQLYIKELEQIGINMKAKNFVIYQGAIDNLALLTPKERTYFLEEISNSGELEVEYNRLMNEGECANKEVCNMMRLRKDLILEKKYLLSQINQANDYKKLQKHCRNKQQEFQLFKLFHIQKDVEHFLDAKENLQSHIDVLQAEKNMAEQLLCDSRRAGNRLSRELAEKEQHLVKLEVECSEKKLQFASKKEITSQLQSKIDSAQRNLASAKSARDARNRNIKDLKDALQQVAQQKAQFDSNIAEQLESQGSSIDLSTSQVQNYQRLKKEVVQQTVQYMQILESINSAQNSDKDSLENKNRQKMELEDELNRKKSKREMANNRISKLEQFITTTRAELERQTDARNALQTEVDACKIKVQELQEELKDVLDQRGGAKADNRQLTEMKDKAETVRILKERYSGVYGRLFDLCKPINSTYNVAVAKVFGKNMDGIITGSEKDALECIKYLKEQKIGRETFLPLDALKVPLVKSRLRNLKEPRNVKLLYDVVKFNPPEINRAVIFAVNDSLVCQTAEDANYAAYELDNNEQYNCVALDGTYYKKSGIMSGGQSDLQRKAKKWEENLLMQLKTKEESLKRELRESLQCTRREHELNIMSTQISGLESRLRFSESDLLQARKETSDLDKQIEHTEEKIKALNDLIADIERSMKERKQRIEEVNGSIIRIEDQVFANFCENIGINNIREYEQTELLVYQEQEKKRMELEEQYNRIFYQLEFERDSDAIRKIEDNIERWERVLHDSMARLVKAKENEHQTEIDIAKHQMEIEELKEECNHISSRVDAVKQKMDNVRRQLAKISKELTGFERDVSGVLSKIKKAKSQWHSIFKNAKADDIPIPTNSRNSTEAAETMDTASSSGRNTQELTAEFLEINFSRLPNNYKDRTPAIIEAHEKHLAAEISEILRKINLIEKPNLKADEKIDDLEDRIDAVDKEIDEKRNIANQLKTEFEQIKRERLKRFMECFEAIATEIDSIYKSLVGSETAQALLAPENPEEPYLGGIRFDCIAPGKRLQAMSQHSGGEKALAILALLFAQCCYKPPPLLLLDEIDAALDNRNIRRLVNYIRSKKHVMQKIAISLKVRFSSYADGVIGITSEPGDLMESKVYSLPINLYPEKVQR